LAASRAQRFFGLLAGRAAVSGGYSGLLPVAMGFSAAGLPLAPSDRQYPLPYPAACLRGRLFFEAPAASRAQRFFGAFSSPCRVDSRGNGGRIAHHLRGGGLPVPPDFSNLSGFPVLSEIFPSFRTPPVFLHRVTRRSLFLPAGISGSVPASPAEKPRKLLFQNPEWLFSLRFFRISPGFSLSLKV